MKHGFDINSLIDLLGFFDFFHLCLICVSSVAKNRLIHYIEQPTASSQFQILGKNLFATFEMFDLQPEQQRRDQGGSVGEGFD